MSSGSPAWSRSRRPKRRRATSRSSAATCCDPAVFDVLRDTPPGRGGEIQLTDALQTLAAMPPSRRRRLRRGVPRSSLRHRRPARLPQGHCASWRANEPTSAPEFAAVAAASSSMTDAESSHEIRRRASRRLPAGIETAVAARAATAGRARLHPERRCVGADGTFRPSTTRPWTATPFASRRRRCLRDAPVSLPVVGDIPAGTRGYSPSHRDSGPHHDRRSDASRSRRRGAASNGPTATSCRCPSRRAPQAGDLREAPGRRRQVRRSGRARQARGSGRRSSASWPPLAAARVLVRPRPRVVVMSTGSELVEPGEPIAGGKIPDSNSFMLAAAAKAAGAPRTASASCQTTRAADRRRSRTS